MPKISIISCLYDGADTSILLTDGTYLRPSLTLHELNMLNRCLEVLVISGKVQIRISSNDPYIWYIFTGNT